MWFNSLQFLFPNTAVHQVNKIKDKIVILITHNKASVLQLGMCKLQINHIDKGMTCTFFVVAGNATDLVRHARHQTVKHTKHQM